MRQAGFKIWKEKTQKSGCRLSENYVDINK